MRGAQTMSMSSLFSQYEAELRWRRPAPLWAAAAFFGGLAAPALFLLPEGGFGQLTLIAAACGYVAALLWILIASAMGRAPQSRRDVVAHVLRFGAVAALLAPFLFQGLLDAMMIAEAPMASSGLSGALPFALEPLALMIGLPLSLCCGIALAWLGFERREPEPLF